MSLIDDRKQISRKKGDGGIYDSHHIIPKCMGGSNCKSNLVLLTPREHFIAHLLLTKMVESPYTGKMYCAIVRFLGKNKLLKNIKINSKTYEKIIIENRKYMSGKNNPFYGKTHTEEVRSLLSQKSKERLLGKRNYFYGKNHTEKSKYLLSLSRSQPIRVYFFDNTSIVFGQYKFLGIHLGKSPHLGNKLMKPQFHYLWKNYNIKKIEKL